MLIVEYDPDVIAIADHIVDMGIGAGKNGGRIVYEGSYEGLEKADTPTGRYLNQVHQLKTECRFAKGYLAIESTSLNNLNNVSTKIPKEVLSVVTGVAGSGKSSLFKSLIKQHKDIILIDQSVIKGNKRSNIATYTEIMDQIHKLFAKLNNVKQALFSSNSEGACPKCKGLGIISIDLAFLDAVEVTCESCNGLDLYRICR